MSQNCKLNLGYLFFICSTLGSVKDKKTTQQQRQPPAPTLAMTLPPRCWPLVCIYRYCLVLFSLSGLTGSACLNFRFGCSIPKWCLYSCSLEKAKSQSGQPSHNLPIYHYGNEELYIESHRHWKEKVTGSRFLLLRHYMYIYISVVYEDDKNNLL